MWSRAARWFYFWSLPSTFSYTQYIIIFIRKFQSICTLNFHHNSSPIDSDFHCLWVIGSHSKHESSGQNYKTEKRSWTIICAIADISRRDRCCVRSTEREKEKFSLHILFSFLPSSSLSTHTRSLRSSQFSSSSLLIIIIIHFELHSTFWHFDFSTSTTTTATLLPLAKPFFHILKNFIDVKSSIFYWRLTI